MEIKIKIERERLADLLCCAMEGGVISYWACVIGYVEPPSDADLSTSEFEPIYIRYPMCETGGGIVLGDVDCSDDCYNVEAAFKPVTVTYAKLVAGLVVMAHDQPRHFGNFMGGNEGAETGDVYMQCVCFGKVVFG